MINKRNVGRHQNQSNNKAERARWFAGGLVFGLTMLSIAMGSVPSKDRVTDDTALYQSLSEIQVAKQEDLNFDGDIARLSALEDRYREERLPRLSDVRRRQELQRKQQAASRRAIPSRVKSPMQRIAAQKYRYSGRASGASAASTASGSRVSARP